MPIRRRAPVGSLCIGLGILGCSSAPPPGLTAIDRTAIQQISDSMVMVANGKQFAAWAAMYTEDAQVLAPNWPAIVGRPAIKRFVEAFPPFSDLRFTTMSIEGAGDMAWRQGTYSMTITPPGSAGVQEQGKFIELWKKLPDGSWQLHRDIFNSDLPLPTPEPATKH